MRKEFKFLESVLEDFGVIKPTLKVKTLSKINGKITTTRLRKV